MSLLIHQYSQISLVIWVEIPGNVQRVFQYLEAVARRCPQLQRLNIDIATESNLALSREIMHTVCIEQELWRAGRSDFKATIKVPGLPSPLRARYNVGADRCTLG